MMKEYLVYITIISLLTFTSCNKDWLEKKEDQSQVVPVKVEHYQAMLDNDSKMNDRYSAMPFFGAEEFTTSKTVWQNSTNPAVRNAYIWNKEIYEGSSAFDWIYSYEKMYLANVVLEGIEKVKIEPREQEAWNNVKGGAFFFRGYVSFSLIEVYAKPYLASVPDKDPGIPIRLTSDVDAPVTRGTIAQAYNQIISDFKSAASLLPLRELYPTRPGRLATWAALARVYLAMGNFTQAEAYCDSCISQYAVLMDYNTSVPGNRTAFERFNPEVLFWAIPSSYSLLSFTNGNSYVDTSLTNLYDKNDLRKTKLFSTLNNKLVFTGPYTGLRLAPGFVGIANDEVYLIRAECRARRNNVAGAMTDLNALLQKRWVTGTFVPFTAADSEASLRLILQERRKELYMRGLRWYDLRRLNTEPRFATTIVRYLDTDKYTLPPNDPRYVYPLPVKDVLVSNLEQNQR